MRRAMLPVLWVLIAALPASGAEHKIFKAEAPIRKLRTVKLDADIGAVKRFDLYPDAPAGKLYTVEVEHDPDIAPKVDLAGGTLSLSADKPRMLQGAPHQEWDVHLSKVPVWDMALNFGAARGVLDLGGLKVREFDLEAGAATVDIGWDKANQVALEHAQIRGGASRIALRGLGHARVQELSYEGGAGSVDLDFSGPLRGTAGVSIQAGVGTIEIKVPKAVGIRIVEKEVALAHISWPDDLDGGSRRETPNYAKAKGKIDLKLSAAVGRIRIARI